MEFTLIYRSKLVIKAISPFLSKNKSVLDIGCGNGVVSYEIKKHFNCKLYSTDIQNYLKRDIKFKKIKKGCILNFDDKEFDIGLIIEVLHHIPFDMQIRLIEEALRVCSEVLIIEDKPTFIAKIIDYLINKVHNAKMPITLTFRTKEEWNDLFIDNGISSKFYNVKTDFYYPFTHYLFHLNKNK